MGVKVVVAALNHAVALQVVNLYSVLERDRLIPLIDELEHGDGLDPQGDDRHDDLFAVEE